MKRVEAGIPKCMELRASWLQSGLLNLMNLAEMEMKMDGAQVARCPVLFDSNSCGENLEHIMMIGYLQEIVSFSMAPVAGSLLFVLACILEHQNSYMPVNRLIAYWFIGHDETWSHNVSSACDQVLGNY